MAALLLVASACADPPAGSEPGAGQESPDAAPYFGGGDPCPASNEVSGRSGCYSAIDGDFDGDGRSDRLELFAEIAPSGFPTKWILRVTGSSVGRREAKGRWWSEQTVGAPPRDAPWWVGYPVAVGAMDVDGDGTDEALVKTVDHVLHGGSVPDFSLFGWRDGGLIPLKSSDGGILTFAVGGVTNYGVGMRCPDEDGDGTNELVLLRVDSAIYPHPRWSRTTYQWDGNVARFVSRERGHMTRDGFPDPDVVEFYRLRCDGLFLAPFS